MGTNLYSLNGGVASEMNEEKYEKEDVLQKIIADNPNLLVRDKDENNSKLYLIEREVESEGIYLDHLLVDSEGVPVLLEVKRSSDTRIRREVVGQMLDYASRASSWDVNSLRSKFEKSNPNLADENKYLFTDAFWDIFSNNLKAEHFKLIFAADSIPDSLRIIIEFLDRAMPDIEVYGVEIHQYKSGDVTLLSTEYIENPLTVEVKTSKGKGDWDYDKAVAYFKTNGFWEFIPVWDALLKEADDMGLQYVYGTGQKYPSALFKYDNLTVISIGAYPGHTYVEVYSGNIATYLDCDISAIVSLASGFAEKSVSEKGKIRLYNLTEDQIPQLKSLLKKIADGIKGKRC